MNCSAVAVQVFVGGEYETQSVTNMTRLVDAGLRAGMPVLGVTAVGDSLGEARAAAYAAAVHVDFAGVRYRRDIASFAHA